MQRSGNFLPLKLTSFKKIRHNLALQCHLACIVKTGRKCSIYLGGKPAFRFGRERVNGDIVLYWSSMSHLMSSGQNVVWCLSGMNWWMLQFTSYITMLVFNGEPKPPCFTYFPGPNYYFPFKTNWVALFSFQYQNWKWVKWYNQHTKGELISTSSMV